MTLGLGKIELRLAKRDVDGKIIDGKFHSTVLTCAEYAEDVARRIVTRGVQPKMCRPTLRDAGFDLD